MTTIPYGPGPVIPPDLPIDIPSNYTPSPPFCAENRILEVNAYLTDYTAAGWQQHMADLAIQNDAWTYYVCAGEFVLYLSPFINLIVLYMIHSFGCRP